MASLIFKDAEAAKAAIMASQQKEIVKLYEDWADEIGERAKYYSHKSTASAPVSERYYKELQKQLRQTSQEVSNEIYKKVKSNIYTVADAVVSDNVKWLESFGFSSEGLNAAFSYVPHEIVQNLVTGQIYDSGWSLSSRIWGDNEQTLKDVYQVMARGLAENKPIYQIAKDLEDYVRPSAQLPWNLRMADGIKIYKKQVDYNAQRLARTLVQHGYQQSFIATTQKNPFVLEYIWRSNGSRVCELCMSRDGQHYKKDELPMDHPNGMCTMEPVVADDMVDQLADWFNSEDGTYPEIDEFAKNFGYTPKLSAGTSGLSYKSFSDVANVKTELIGKVDYGNVHKPGKLVEYAVDYVGDGSDVVVFFDEHSNYRQLIDSMSPEEQKAFKNIWSKGKMMQGQQYKGFANMKPSEQKATRVFDKYLDQATIDKSVQVVRLSDAQLVLGKGNREATLELLTAQKGQQVVCGANMSFAAASEGIRVVPTGPAPTVEYILKVDQGSTGAGMFIGDDAINIWGNKQREFMTNRDIWMTVGDTTYDEARNVYKVELRYGGLMEHDYGKK